MAAAKAFSEQAVYESIGAMMRAAAEAAVLEAEKLHGFALDFSEESLGYLDAILAHAALSSTLDVERQTKLWGGYFGETLRALYGGEWEFTQYPQSTTAVPTLLVRGAKVYPLMKVYRRLTLGEGERMDSFYAMLKQKLGAAG
jgi:hypothetical protein